MYNNSGQKIISMATILTVISVVVSIVIGIGLWVGIAELADGVVGFFVGLIVAAIGCVIAWVLNLLLAGFGELVSDTHELLSIAKKEAGAEKTAPSGSRNVTQSATENAMSTPPEPNAAQADSLIRHAFISLEGGEWSKADGIFEQALNFAPENAKAYVGKLCAELHINREDDLIGCSSPIRESVNYKRALQFADEKYKKTLELYALTPDEQKAADIDGKEQAYQSILSRIESEKNSKKSYNSLEETRALNSFLGLMSELEALGDYKDSLTVLRGLRTPIGNGSGLECPVCGASQQSGRLKCYRCGLSFGSE